MYNKNKNKYYNKKNIYYRPWGKYTNLFEGKKIFNQRVVYKERYFKFTKTSS